MGKKSTLQQSENYEVKYTPLPEIKLKSGFYTLFQNQRGKKHTMLLIIIFKKIIWEYPPPVVTSIINIVIKYFRIDI